MKVIQLLFVLLCASCLGQNLFPGPGSPLQLDSTRLYPAIISGGGGTIIVTNASFNFITNQYFFTSNAYITNGYVTFLTNQQFFSTNVNITYLTNQNLYVTNVNVYDSVVIETNLTVKQNINVNGKATFSQIIITNGFFTGTNTWSGPTNTIDVSIYRQSYQTVTPVQFSGYINSSNSLAAEMQISIYNNSSSNITVTYGQGVTDRDFNSQFTLTNGNKGIFWIQVDPSLKKGTNLVANQF